MSQTGHPISPPPVPGTPPSGVRRHHTISSSRTRTSARAPISEETVEQTQLGYEDEVIDRQDWTLNEVGAVGEALQKSSLHRQSSLPTRYHRGFHGQASRQAGNLTPRTMNSLSAIAGHEGDEEDWEREMRGLRDEEENNIASADNPQHQQVMDAHSQSSNQSPLSPHFGPPHVPSPPPASSVRRHQSLTYGAAGGVRHMASSGLRRSGTLQAHIKHSDVSEANQSPSPTNADEEYGDDQTYEEESYFARSPPQQQQHQGQYPTSPINRSSPWSTPGEWRTPGGSIGSTNSGNNVAIDDVQRALSALEIASNSSTPYPSNSAGNFQGGQSAHPPRFNPSHPPPLQAPGMRSQNSGDSSRKLQLVTNFDGGRKTPLTQGGHGPASASAYVPAIGHTVPQGQQQQQHQRGGSGPNERDDRALTVSNTSWDQKERLLSGRSSNPNLQYGYSQGKVGGAGVPSVPSIPAQYLNQQQGGSAPRLGVATSFGPGQGSQNQMPANVGMGNQPPQGFVGSPIDVPSLIATKGYNPSNFDIRPPFARFFVIKSYTEDDVHKSLKYEIWSSTDPGNKRLDKAFKECAGRGPIYLFFSVNASGHFCGMAEMLTPVDYTRSSTVWASDKWKGVFKVRWIFVRDIPNATLRHIRLNNTQERKPVTNSRDTQELLPDAGQEMLRIFHSHPARTSLLQDFAFYELQAMQKVQSGPPSPSHSSVPSLHSPQPQQLSPTNQLQQNPFAMTYATQMAQMTPMMQMQMQMNMNMNQQFAMPQAQAMHQSVMRHPSPGPAGGAMPSVGQAFMGMGGGPQF